MSDSGPRLGDPDGLIPLAPFATTMGVRMPLFTPPEVWEEVARHSPYNLCHELNKALGNALNEVGGTRADRPYISFKYWIPSETGASRRVRMRVEARLSEEKGPWMLLSKEPQPSLHGVSVD